MRQTAQIATAPPADDLAMHDELRLHGFTSTKQFLRRMLEIFQALPETATTFEIIMAIDSDDLVRPCIKVTAMSGESRNLFRRDLDLFCFALTGHKPIFY